MLEFDTRREAKAYAFEEDLGKRVLLAPLKVYRTFYRALFELYTKGTWPKEPEKLGLLSVLTYELEEGAEQADEESEDQ